MALLAGSLMSTACAAEKPAVAKDAAAALAPLPTGSLAVPAEQLSRLEITQPGRETVTLSVINGSWRTESPLLYPANTPAVEQMVAVLAEIEIQRRVAEQPEPKHRVTANSGVEVRAWTVDGALQPFTVGASSGEETFVQRAGEDQVYAVRGRCRRIFDLSFEQLRDPTVTNLDITHIERVTYVTRLGELEIVADPGHPGTFLEASPSIRNFNSERATKNVAVLSELFAKGFVDDPVDTTATGLFNPDTARIEVALRGESEPLIVHVGARTKNGRLHLRTSASDQVFLVSKHLASSLVPQRKHLERSDGEVQEHREQALAQQASAKEEATTHAAEHKHGTELPSQVPADLMGELRSLASEQRD